MEKQIRLTEVGSCRAQIYINSTKIERIRQGYQTTNIRMESGNDYEVEESAEYIVSAIEEKGD